MMHSGIEETQKLEQYKRVLLRFLAIEPDTLGSLKLIIGGDSTLIEKALYSLVQEGRVAYRGNGVYAAKGTMTG